MKRWPSITRGGCSFLICRSLFQPSFTFVGLSGTVCLSTGWFFENRCIVGAAASLRPRFLVLPQIVGGLADGTSGTLTAPDLDLNMEWQLGEEVMEHIEILVLDEAASGQYRMKVIYLFAV